MDDAVVLLADAFPGITRPVLERLAARLPARSRRVKVAIDEALGVASSEGGRDPMRSDLARQISQIVVAFIARLSTDDQLLLRLRFHAQMTVAQIARALHKDQQPLYRQLRKHFEALRVELTTAGVAHHDVEELIGSDTVVLDFDWKNDDLRPSEPDESEVRARQEESS